MLHVHSMLVGEAMPAPSIHLVSCPPPFLPSSLYCALRVRRRGRVTYAFCGRLLVYAGASMPAPSVPSSPLPCDLLPNEPLSLSGAGEIATRLMDKRVQAGLGARAASIDGVGSKTASSTAWHVIIHIL